MGPNISEIADGIYRISVFVPDIAPPAGFTFNHFLVLGDEPLLFHTGLRKMFPLVSEAVARIMPVGNLRWITFGHYEADECGAMNEWLAMAPDAQVAHGMTGCLVSLNDMSDRPPRVLANGEVIDIGGKRIRYLDTPHTPHGWDAGVIYEEIDPNPAVRRPLHPARQWPGADRGRHRRSGDRRRGPVPVLQPEPGHGNDDPYARNAVATHAGADARTILRGRWPSRLVRTGG